MSYDPLVQPHVSADTALPNSYWQATAPAFPGRPLQDKLHTEYAVIGAGYTGLSAALTLAEAGKQVTVLEASQVGFGCAGRNGGFVLKGTGRYSLSAIAEKWSHAVALGMRDEFAHAVSLLESRVNNYNIACDMQYGPYLKIAHNAKQAASLKRAQRINQFEFDSNESYLSPPALAEILDIKKAHGAVKQDGLALHPLKLVNGYASACEQQGATIYSHSPVTGMTSQQSGYVLHTPQADVHAQRVIIASNAYTPKKLHPLVDNKQFPVQSSILVTSPLTAEQRIATRLTQPMTMMDTRMMKYYYRVLPDGRLLFGGRGAVNGSGKGDAASQARLRKAMLESFPALASASVDYFWNGWVSVALDSLPRVVTDSSNSLGYAMGYCGSGVSFAALAGTRLAQKMLGESLDTRLPVYASALPRYPFAGLRRVALHTLYAWGALAE